MLLTIFAKSSNMAFLPLGHDTLPWLLVVGTFGVIWYARRIISWRNRNPRGLPLPPGPKGLPIIGNITQLPATKQWEGYAKLSEEYGDIIYLEAFGQPVVLLNSLSRSTALLEKRAVNYSDRPATSVIGLLGINWDFSVMQYGTSWRQHRRAFHEHFNHNAVHKAHPIMYDETVRFLRRLRDNPEQFIQQTEVFFGTVIMRTTYGFDDFEYNKALVYDAQKATDAVADALIPGKFLVDTFPILRHVPAWFPGAGFRTHFKDIAKINNNILHSPFERAKQDAVMSDEKSAYKSLAASLIERLPQQENPKHSESEILARNVCGVAYVAGADTTTTSAIAAIFVLATHPEVQKKAQAEVEFIVGSDRLPTIDDREALPYVHAVVKEIGRWYTVTPLGLPHVTTSDDEYDGYFIPKGSYIIANSWAITHDPELFEKPFDFVPERHIKEGKIDASAPEAAFGFGRRVCPGRHFSDDVLFLFVASLLSVFNFSPMKDEAGNAIPMELDTNEYLVARPRPFKCAVTLRSEQESLIL